MAFNSLNHLITALTKQPGWAQYQRYSRLCQCWNEVIDPKIVFHTRPVYIQRNSLWVATSSSVWAQHLSLQRHLFLKSINARFPEEPLVDIRFSSAKWHSYQLVADTFVESSHPSKIDFPVPCPQNVSDSLMTPAIAFQRWTDLMKGISQNMPLCPRCHCPTPPGELKRWSLCMHCATQQWQTNFSSTQ
jgi:predicted nucleic acid-binding Zn ribbon protein